MTAKNTKEFIRSKSNKKAHTWSFEEEKKLFDLHSSGLSTDDICAAFPTRKRTNVINKMGRMHLSRKNTFVQI